MKFKNVYIRPWFAYLKEFIKGLFSPRLYYELQLSQNATCASQITIVHGPPKDYLLRRVCLCKVNPIPLTLHQLCYINQIYLTYKCFKLHLMPNMQSSLKSQNIWQSSRQQYHTKTMVIFAFLFLPSVSTLMHFFKVGCGYQTTCLCLSITTMVLPILTF